MISSAVAIPEVPPIQPPSTDEQSTAPSSPTLKRRLSSSPSPEAPKRPRLDTDHTNGSQQSPPSSTTAASPPQRKPSLVTPVEEKKRNQRLFGGLLSTLSQTSSTKPQHRRRDEVEARQRERLRKDTEEREAETRRRKLEIDERRREEQKTWDGEGRELRWRRTRMMAECLVTESLPPLYWKPWELRDEEKQKIQLRRDEAEETIKREKEKLGLVSPTRAIAEIPELGDKARSLHEEDQTSKINGNNSPDQDKQLEAYNNDAGSEQTDAKATNSFESSSERMPNAEEPEAEPKTKEDDHAGEELVEGNEDDVIY